MEKIRAKHNVNIDVARFGTVDPAELCELVAQSIPADVLKNAKRILDVGIGCGGIARAIVNRLVNELYVDWDDAILRVHGVDNNLALVNKAKRNGFVHTVCEDFLQWQPEMQFDVIVGNPPYQRPREVRNIGAPLWPEFLEKSMDLLCDGGYLGLVIPATWMKRLNGKAWKVIKKYDLVSCDPDVKWAFPGVGGPGVGFSTILLRKGNYGGTTLVNGGISVDFHNDVFPTNNLEFNGKALEFLASVKQRMLTLDVKSGPVNPSINSESYSSVPTDTHTFNVFYSGAPNRRSMWCDEPVGDCGKLKLVVPCSGNVYKNMEITEKGAGRQTSYILGTMEELQEIQQLLLTEESKKLTNLMAEGRFFSPLSWVVR